MILFLKQPREASLVLDSKWLNQIGNRWYIQFEIMKKTLTRRKSETTLNSKQLGRQPSKTHFQKQSKSKQLHKTTKRQIIGKLYKKHQQYDATQCDPRGRVQTENTNTLNLPIRAKKHSHFGKSSLTQKNQTGKIKIKLNNQQVSQEKKINKSTVNRTIAKSKSHVKLGSVYNLGTKRKSLSPFQSKYHQNFTSVHSEALQGRTDSVMDTDRLVMYSSKQSSGIAQLKSNKSNSKIKKNPSKSNLSSKEKVKRERKNQMHSTANNTKGKQEMRLHKLDNKLNDVKKIAIPASLTQQILRKIAANQKNGTSIPDKGSKVKRKKQSKNNGKAIEELQKIDRYNKIIHKIPMESNLIRREQTEVSFQQFAQDELRKRFSNNRRAKIMTEAYSEEDEQSGSQHFFYRQKLKHLVKETEKLPFKVNDQFNEQPQLLRINEKWLRQSDSEQSSHKNSILSDKMYLPYPEQGTTERQEPLTLTKQNTSHRSIINSESEKNSAASIKSRHKKLVEQTSLVTLKEFQSARKEALEHENLIIQTHLKDRQKSNSSSSSSSQKDSSTEYNKKETEGELLNLLKDLLQEQTLENSIKNKIKRAIFEKGYKQSSQKAEQLDKQITQPISKESLPQGIKFKKTLKITIDQESHKKPMIEESPPITPQSIGKKPEDLSESNKKGDLNRSYVQKRIRSQISSEKGFNSPRIIPQIDVKLVNIARSFSQRGNYSGEKNLISPHSSNKSSPFKNTRLGNLVSPHSNSNSHPQKQFFFFKQEPQVKSARGSSSEIKKQISNSKSKHNGSRSFAEQLNESAQYTSPNKNKKETENNPHPLNVGEAEDLKWSEIKQLSEQRQELRSLCNQQQVKLPQIIETSFQFVEDLAITVFKFIKDFEINGSEYSLKQLPYFYELMQRVASFKDFKRLLVLDKQELVENKEDQPVPEFFYCAKYYYPSLFGKQFVRQLIRENSQARQLLVRNGYQRIADDSEIEEHHQMAFLLAVFHAMEEAAFIHYQTAATYYHNLELDLQRALRMRHVQEDGPIPRNVYKYFEKLAFSVISEVTSWSTNINTLEYQQNPQNGLNKVILDQYARRVQQQNARKFVIGEIMDSQQIKNNEQWILSEVSELIWIEEVDWIINFVTQKWESQKINLSHVQQEDEALQLILQF